LGRWSSRIPTEFHVFRRTQDPGLRKQRFAYRTIAFFGRSSQIVQLRYLLVTQMSSPTTPKSKLLGLGCSHFARRYYGNRISFSSCGYLDVSVPRVFLQLSYEFT